MSESLDKIFETKEDERWKLVKEFMDTKDIEGKTDLKDSDIEYLTKIELLEDVINKHFFKQTVKLDKDGKELKDKTGKPILENKSCLQITYLKKYCTFFRINRISLKRKSREELVKMVQSISGADSDMNASFKKKLLGI